VTAAGGQKAGREMWIKDGPMVEAVKAKTKPASAPLVPQADPMKFDMPRFEMPKVEMPAAFRDLAEKGVVQAKEGYERMKAAAEETNDMIETTYSTMSKGASDYGLKVLEVTRLNTNATFDFFEELMGVKSFAEVVELSTSHTRKQFETFTAQAKELTELAQKVAVESAEPVKSGFTKAMKKVA
jgi:phasin